MTTPDVPDKRFAQGPPLPHTGSYRRGCRCPDCRLKQRNRQAGYSAASYRRKQAEVASMKAELTALRQWLASAPSATGEQGATQ